MNARRRLELLLDDDNWIEHDAELASSDPLHFADTKEYATRLKEAQQKLGMKDAILTAEGTLNGRGVICCSMEFGFIGGSMGAVVGEKVARAIERSLAQKLPLDRRLLLRRRAHDGRHGEPDAVGQSFRSPRATRRRAYPLYLCAYRSDHRRRDGKFRHAGRLEHCRAGRLIGFAGPRVIEQTIRQKLPEGFQTAEFLLEHGFLDAVVSRKEMKNYISRSLDFFLQPCP